MVEHATLKNLGGAQLVAAMNEVHLVGVAREKVGFLGGGVTAADDRDRMIAEERAVADRAVRDALARVLELTGNAELHGRAARRDDGRWRQVDVAVVRDALEETV